MAKAPLAKTPVAKAPLAKTPVAKAPAAKAPLAKTPVAKAPAAKAPLAKTPVAKAPLAKTPLAKAPAAKTPLAKATAAKTPVSKVPAAKAPLAKTPVSKAPAAKAPAGKVPVTKTPLGAKAPVGKAPAAKTFRARPVSKNTTAKARPAVAGPTPPGTPLEVSEKTYRGSFDSNIINPAYDLAVKKYYADFRVGAKLLRMYGPSPKDVIAFVLKYKASNDEVSSQLVNELQQEKLQIRADLPKIGKKVKTLESELKKLKLSPETKQVYSSELLEAKGELTRKQQRIRKVDYELKIITRKPPV